MFSSDTQLSAAIFCPLSSGTDVALQSRLAGGTATIFAPTEPSVQFKNVFSCYMPSDLWQKRVTKFQRKFTDFCVKV